MVKRSDPSDNQGDNGGVQVAWLQSSELDQWARGWALLSLPMGRLSGRGARFIATILFR